MSPFWQKSIERVGWQFGESAHIDVRGGQGVHQADADRAHPGAAARLEREGSGLFRIRHTQQQHFCLLTDVPRRAHNWYM